MNPDLSRHIKRVDELLQNRDDNLLDRCYNLYDVISSTGFDEEILLIKYICESYTPSSNDIPLLDDGSLSDVVNYSKTELSLLMSRYGDLINGLLQNMIVRGYEDSMDEDVFYRELWSTITAQIPADIKARAFALFFIIIDVRIPYFKLEKGLKLDDEEFELLSSSVDSETFKRLVYINRCNVFEQKTEFASILLNEIENPILTYNQRVLVMSMIIQILEKIYSIEKNN